MRHVFLAVVMILLVAGDVGATVSSSSIPAGETSPNTTLERDIYYKVLDTVSGPRASQLSGSDYPTVLGESRVVVWIVAQQHLYWVAFVLGTFVLVTLLEVWALLDRNGHRGGVLGALAREFLDLVMLAVALAAILGAMLFIVLLALYPDLTTYLVSVFRPVFLVFGVLVLVFTVLAALYYFTWSCLRPGWSQWLHASLGILVNVTGVTLAMLGNAWSSFMMAPAGVDQRGRYLGHVWNTIHTALWNPLNLHRFAGHLLCAGAVLAAYAAARALMATAVEEKAHFDRMGAVALVFLFGALITMPAGGNWLLRGIYAYRQQMGITLLGGLMAWLGIVLVGAMAILFLGLNYYLWQRIASAGGSDSYGWMSKWVFGMLALCALVYITPHTLIMTPLELKHMGGQQHPVLGSYGVESAKSAAVNLMILVSTWSFVLWRFSHRGVLPEDFPRVFRTLAVVFLTGAVNILWLGIYGYYIPANVRVGLSVPMMATTFSVILMGVIISLRSTRGTAPSESEWGRLSSRGYYTLLLIAFMVTWIMGLGGYRRSSLRLYWHVTEIMKDASPWAFTHTTGFAVNVITLNALLFWAGIAALLWVTKTRVAQHETSEARPLGGA
jgi:hypothetical protein